MRGRAGRRAKMQECVGLKEEYDEIDGADFGGRPPWPNPYQLNL